MNKKAYYRFKKKKQQEIYKRLLAEEVYTFL